MYKFDSSKFKSKNKETEAPKFDQYGNPHQMTYNAKSISET